MIKKLRLLIAAWALAPKYITLDDVFTACGADLKGSVTKLQHDFTVMQAKVSTLGVDLTPEIIMKIVTASDKISNSQKILITNILQSQNLRNASYLG